VHYRLKSEGKQLIGEVADLWQGPHGVRVSPPPPDCWPLPGCSGCRTSGTWTQPATTKPLKEAMQRAANSRKSYKMQCCESEFFPSQIRIKELKYFNPKIVSKLSEIGMIRVVHPGSGSRFFTHPESRIRIRNTDKMLPFLKFKIDLNLYSQYCDAFPFKASWRNF
jgi:hypothetical protein